MLIYDDIRFQLNNLKPKLEDLRLALDLDKAKAEIEELEHKAAEPEFWNDPSESQKVLQRTKQLKDKVANYAALYTMYEDVVTTIEMAEEMEDESLFPEVQAGYDAFTEELERQTLTTLLTGEYDKSNVIMSFHAGAGGTEARTGPLCWCVCIPSGPTARAISGRCWTIWTAKKPASRAPSCLSRVKMPSVI